MRLAYLICLMLVACSAGDMRAAPPGDQAASGSKEVLLRFCVDIDSAEGDIILAKKGLWLKRRLSRDLLVVTWPDDRSVEDVLGQLDSSSGVCLAQPNYEYEAVPAENGAK